MNIYLKVAEHAKSAASERLPSFGWTVIGGEFAGGLVPEHGPDDRHGGEALGIQRQRPAVILQQRRALTHAAPRQLQRIIRAHRRGVCDLVKRARRIELADAEPDPEEVGHALVDESRGDERGVDRRHGVVGADHCRQQRWSAASRMGSPAGTWKVDQTRAKQAQPQRKASVWAYCSRSRCPCPLSARHAPSPPGWPCSDAPPGSCSPGTWSRHPSRRRSRR